MILQALADYYGQLLREHPDEVAPPGWSPQRVSCMLEIDLNGRLVNVIPAEDKRGWPTVVPEQAKRASGIVSNFLCDKPAYFLGVSSKGKPERDAKCFAASRERHLEILSEVDSDRSRAVVRFFKTWDPALAEENAAFVRAKDVLMADGNLVFYVRGIGEALEDPAIRAAWNAHATSSSDDGPQMICLVTGERAPIARIHPSIKGVYGGQAAGTTLVGFNSRAFESYGGDEKQGLNAPVSKSATQAYTTALNYLLAEPSHHLRLGDTTIVYWSTAKDKGNSWVFSLLGGGQATTGVDVNSVLDALAKKLAAGKHVTDDTIDLDATFYVLGLSPNVAMLSVRFFYQDTFGNIVNNLLRHYKRIEVARPPQAPKYLTPYQLLQGVENPNSKKPVISSELGGAFMRSVLQDLPYPEGLFQNALLRIHASQNDSDKRTRKVTRARAAIIRAYLLKNRHYSEEDVTVELNEQRNETAYCLGRAFSILEQIQETANGKATVTNRYIDSACATPATVFPTLLRLATAHLNKIENKTPGLAVHYKKMLENALGEDRVPVFPRRLSPTEQGDFFLGYYHQDQKRYEKKSSDADETVNPDAESNQEA